jgi:hypothetical protein
MSFFQTYGLGVVIASSYFFLHAMLAALKTSCKERERELWNDLALLFTGSVMVYLIGLIARSLSEFL